MVEEKDGTGVEDVGATCMPLTYLSVPQTLAPSHRAQVFI